MPVLWMVSIWSYILLFLSSQVVEVCTWLTSRTIDYLIQFSGVLNYHFSLCSFLKPIFKNSEHNNRAVCTRALFSCFRRSVQKSFGFLRSTL